MIYRYKLLSVLALLVCGLLLCGASASAEGLPVTSPFGWRVHPITGAWRFHSGVDLGYGYGTAVPAVWAGQVVQAGDYDDGYGNQVLLYHSANDSYTRYGHMSRVYVAVGDQVEGWQTIGLVGSTGNSTGPHLHLEYITRASDGGWQYVDPLSIWQ